MEQTNFTDNFNKNSNIFADIDIENLNFEAIDKGLGFHHKETKLNQSSKSGSYRIQNNSFSTNKKIKEVAVPTLRTDSSLGSNEISLEEAFSVNANNNHQDFIATKKSISIKDINTNDVLIESSLEKVSAAWAVDLTLILLSIIAALILFGSATGVNFDEFKEFFMRNESQVFIGVFFIIFYLLYFSVLDLNSSPGKLLFGTRLVAANNERLTVFNTFTRALVILISIPLFMLPIVFGLHNKISKTISVEEKW